MAEIKKVIGLMSGTSLDGVDAAMIETDGEAVARPGPGLTIAYDTKTRALLRAALLARMAGVPGLEGLAAEADALVQLSSGRPLMMLPMRINVR